MYATSSKLLPYSIYRIVSILRRDLSTVITVLRSGEVGVFILLCSTVSFQGAHTY